MIVPAIFTIVDDIEQWLSPRFSRALSHHEPIATPRLPVA